MRIAVFLVALLLPGCLGQASESAKPPIPPCEPVDSAPHRSAATRSDPSGMYHLEWAPRAGNLSVNETADIRLSWFAEFDDNSSYAVSYRVYAPEGLDPVCGTVGSAAFARDGAETLVRLRAMHAGTYTVTLVKANGYHELPEAPDPRNETIALATFTVR